MMKKITFCLLFLLSLAIVNQAYSQSRSKKSKQKKIASFKGHKSGFTNNKRYNSIGGSVNFLNYFGDLSPNASWGSTDFGSTRPGFGILGERRINPHTSLRAEFLYGRIRGGDFSADPTDPNARFRYVRNLHFRNDIKELTFSSVFDLFGNYGSYMTRVGFTPYLALGLTFFHHDPRAKAPERMPDGTSLDQGGQWVRLKPLGTEGQYSESLENGPKPYSNFQIAIPVAVGIRYRLNNFMDFSFELAYRHTFTDYLDDVSGSWVDPGALNSDLARAMADRSLETTNAINGKPRALDIESVAPIVGNTTTFVSDYDGKTYTAVSGYGQQGGAPMRGNPRNNDLYFVTSFKVTYIIGGSFRNAKFR
jgi:hypothetical protein